MPSWPEVQKSQFGQMNRLFSLLIHQTDYEDFPRLDLLKWGRPLKTYTLAIAANATDVAAVRVSTPNFT